MPITNINVRKVPIPTNTLVKLSQQAFMCHYELLWEHIYSKLIWKSNTHHLLHLALYNFNNFVPVGTYILVPLPQTDHDERVLEYPYYISRKNIKNEKRGRNGTGQKSNETRNVTCSHNNYMFFTLYDTTSRGVWPHWGPCLLRFVASYYST